MQLDYRISRCTTRNFSFALDGILIMNNMIIVVDDFVIVGVDDTL